MILRRYLKLTYSYASRKKILDHDIDNVDLDLLPFKLALLPTKFPNPNELKLNSTDVGVYKIATWNIERPKKNSTKTNLALNKIHELDADVLVLTETSSALNLSQLYPYSISTKPYERTPNEQWVTIWSKWEITKQIDTIDNYRTVSGIINSPFGKFAIFGTIIPYHQAGVSGNRYGNMNYKAWEYHEKDLYLQQSNWKQLLTAESLPLIVIGDFNQTRSKTRGYGTKKVRKILTDLLEEIDLNCVTEKDFSETHLTPDPKRGKIRNNIDHICISNVLLTRFNKYEVGAWNHFTEKGEYMSDHNGVYINFEII